MYCINCGNKLDEEFKFCPNCGKKVKVLDDLYVEIKKYVCSKENISVKELKDKFGLNQVKASSYMDRLEKDNIIGPSNGRKPREVLKKEKQKQENVFTKDIFDTPDYTSDYDSDDIKNNTFLGILSYINFLVLIPYFYNNNSKFVKYHSTQGMNLFIIWVIYAFLRNMAYLIKVENLVVVGEFKAVRLVTPWFITYPFDVIGVLIAIISIIGIIYVCEGKAKELPLINKIKIIK